MTNSFDDACEVINGRIRRWGWFAERGRWLRVVLLDDGATVHNAFCDRGFRR
jgi:hypothetical protein